MPTTGADASDWNIRLETARLVLRPLSLADAPAIERFASDWEVARHTSHIPHPYPPGAAAEWLVTRRDDPDKPPLWGIERREGELIGCIELRPESEPAGATVGFWIGRPYWGRGYAGEALAAVVDHAFDDLGLPRVEASARPDNRASIRVQEKLGFRFVGTEQVAAPARGGAMAIDRRILTPADRAAKWPLPPGNSHRPAIGLPSGRRATRTRPSASTSATAATSTTPPTGSGHWAARSAGVRIRRSIAIAPPRAGAAICSVPTKRKPSFS